MKGSWSLGDLPGIFNTDRDPAVRRFIIAVSDEPVGYFQYYWANKVGGGWWPNIPPDTAGWDLFLGDKMYLSQGLGKAVAHEATQFLFAEGAKKIIVDPSPDHVVMRKILEHVGYKDCGEIETPDGVAILYSLSFSPDRNDG